MSRITPLGLTLAVAICFSFAQGQQAKDPILLTAQDAPPSWKIQAPYPNNPLKRAVLAGRASYGQLSTKADLQLDCRSGREGPRLNLVFLPAEIKFDADPFEGPGGLGERTTLHLNLNKVTWSHYFSGYFVEGGAFVLSFDLSSAEARLSTSASSAQPLTISLAAAKEGELHFAFQLPPSGQAIHAMVSPCLNQRR